MNDYQCLLESIDESISLIKKKSLLGVNEDMSLLDLSGALDTPSLLSRCDDVCERYKTNKPKIRVIHHLACSGGTLISKCLASMPNVFLLSEIHPFTNLGRIKEKPSYSPTDIVGLSYYADIPNHELLAEKLFRQSIKEVYKHVDKLGGILLLRDHTHSDYCSDMSIPKRSRLSALLENDFEVESVLTIRDPIDSYTSLVKNGWVHFSPASFEEYCERVLKMLEQFSSDQIFSYEEFIDSPQLVLKKITSRINLPFDDAFEDIFGSFNVTGDSGRSSDVIAKRERQRGENEYSTMKESDRYQLIISKFRI